MINKNFNGYKFIIGVDISCIADPVTGIARYTIETLSTMIESSPDIHWVLFSDNHNKNHELLRFNNSSFNIFFSSNFTFSKILWGQFALPFLLINMEFDLFWFPTHRIPVLFKNNYPIVITIHDLNHKVVPVTMKFFSKILDTLLMPLAIMRANKIISISISTTNDLLKFFPNSMGKISTVLSGVKNLTTSQVKPSFFDQLLNDEYILFVGTLEPRKNLSRLLSAFSLIPDSVLKNTKLVLVGPAGWGKDSIATLISNYQLQDRVITLGFLSDSELNYLYSKCKFLIMPSLYEGFGFPLVEAMKFGRCLITSNTSSMPEVAGDAALFIDPLSISSIRDAIILLLIDKSLLLKLELNAIKRSSLFDISATSSNIIKVFKSLAA